MDRNEAYIKYRHDQILFCDETVRQFIPKIIQKAVSSIGNNFVSRSIHFFIDVVYFAKILKIRIENTQNRELLSGKGFRKSANVVMLKSITTKIFKGETKLAEKTFPIGIVLK